MLILCCGVMSWAVSSHSLGSCPAWVLNENVTTWANINTSQYNNKPTSVTGRQQETKQPQYMTDLHLTDTSKFRGNCIHCLQIRENIKNLFTFSSEGARQIFTVHNKKCLTEMRWIKDLKQLFNLTNFRLGFKTQHVQKKKKTWLYSFTFLSAIIISCMI